MFDVNKIQNINLPFASTWTLPWLPTIPMAISIAIASIRSRTIFDIYAKEQKYYNTLLDQQINQ